MITAIHENIFELIKRSMWHTGTVSYVDWPLFEEMKQHSIVALPAGILSQLDMPDDLREAWKMANYQQITYNVNYRRTQEELPIIVPYAILKGSSAAKYYPNPIYRAMGDIDIMPRRKDYETVCDMLLQNGFREVTNEDEHVRARHREFFINSIEIEVHAYYAHKNDPAKAKALDDLIVDNIIASHELPDLVNGIVLLEHINHHMESGLGLRHIIDWMMYVNGCLPDEKWREFQPLVQMTGLDKLAAVTTRMCEIYLGLPERKWCSGVEPDVCERLMEYVLENGNFGRKKEEDSRVSARFLSSSRSLTGTLQFLQSRGIINWKAAQKYRFLRPFAWMYQAGRYFVKGFSRKGLISKLKSEYKDGKKRNDLFDELNVSREEYGIVYYKNGEYFKG